MIDYQSQEGAAEQKTPLKESMAGAIPMYQRKKGSANAAHSLDDLEGGTMRGHHNDANANILEQQNHERLSDLAQHVARLKGLTLEIGQEVREQNSLLDQMDSGFSNTRDLLQGSLRRIGTLLEQGGTKHMCYMVLFSVFVISFLWWLMTYKGTSGA
jgi:blocked early in transport 1